MGHPPRLSRRRFLAAVSALAATHGLDPLALGEALAAPAPPPGSLEGTSTAVRTLLRGAVRQGEYHALTTGPGEPWVPRTDVLGRGPGVRCSTSGTSPTPTWSTPSRRAGSRR